MRKIIGGVVIILGIAIIGSGVFLQLSNQNESKENESKKETNTFQRLNSFNTEEACSIYEPVSTYLNFNDYTKVSFTYPNCVHEYKLSFWYKMLNSEDNNLKINITKEKDTANNYMNMKKTSIIALKNEKYYSDVTYTEGKTTTNDGLEVSLLECNYKYNLITTASTYDIWYIAVELDEELLLTYEINAYNKVISYEAVKELFANIKVEKDAATFKNSVIEDKYQIGKIKQNKKGSYTNGYQINFKIPTKYPEVDAIASNYDESNFEYEDLDGKIYASIKLEIDDFYETFLEKVENNREVSLANYKENTDTYRNTTDSGLIKKTINGKEVYYYIYKYDYYVDNKKSSSGDFSVIYYEVAPNFYYKVYLSTRDIDINEAVISDFLNFTVEEY